MPGVGLSAVSNLAAHVPRDASRSRASKYRQPATMCEKQSPEEQRGGDALAPEAEATGSKTCPGGT
jgi:hypothetical protein